MIVELWAQTEVGLVRKGNEDNYLILDLSTARSWIPSNGDFPQDLERFEIGPRGLVLAVSDGMGGALAGDVASAMAVEAVREMLTDSETSYSDDERWLISSIQNAVVYANLSILCKSQEDVNLAGMGATFTGAALNGDVLNFSQVGDSRAYVIRGDQIRQVTKDQSLVQQLVDVGQITEVEAETHMFRNVILQALGAQSDVSPATGQVHLRRGDILLLCSDGLSGKLRSDEILNIVRTGNDVRAACKALVDEAILKGGEDNITVVLARIVGDDLQESPGDRIVVELPAVEDDRTLQSDLDMDTERGP
ncbi:MAG TPA: PP2C family serine/threonine-protein phosphatase [Pyrinomonadaceae bacterium]|jgi:protein phosphatase|nr:PP2C family serine/threonine-protein phosphatase [Pyrinomonadaceae bacterium]